MSKGASASGGSGPADRGKRTSEEQAAFEQEMETLGGYTNLVRAQYTASQQEMNAEIKAAEARGASERTIDEIRERRTPWLTRLMLLVIALVVLMVVAFVLFNSRGVSPTSGLAGGGSAEIARIAPPEPAPTPEQVLPPEVFTITCGDCGDGVTQVPLDLNKAAKYQFGYDAGGSRIAILTVVDSEEYDTLATSFDDAYEQAQASGEDVDPPKYLDGVGDGAVVYGTSAVFKNGDSCGILFTNVFQDAGGEQGAAVAPDELEKLTRIAAPRL
jgi:hypothetical protein